MGSGERPRVIGGCGVRRSEWSERPGGRGIDESAGLRIMAKIKAEEPLIILDGPCMKMSSWAAASAATP
jgi:hypothetical protein